MSKHNYLYIIWKEPKTRRNYTVAKLSKEEAGYSFEYCNEFLGAKEAGWDLIQAFPEVKRYESKEMFPVFQSRLPDKKRKGIDDILRKYGLESYDSYELLKQSGGRLPIDTYEFVDPIFDDDKTIEREFYIVGVRHKSKCVGENCGKRPELDIGLDLVLKMAPENKYDSFAVEVETARGEPLGYIPRYYSQSIFERLRKGMSYSCRVIEIGENANCQECVKVKLRMPAIKMKMPN